MKKIAVSVILTLAIMAGTLGMALPAFAAEITLAKDTDPPTPNIYRVGDTILYILTVANPATNNATNTISGVHDTLPDGTVVSLNASNVVLVPGQSVTYTLDYVVDADDLQSIGGAWTVTNILHATGNDSLGGIINSTTNKTSTVIQPAIDLEKLVNGADADSPPGPTVSANDTVTFTFIVTNTGDSDLTNVIVNDDMLGIVGSVASLPVSANQTFTVTTNASGGQHTNTANVTATPPVGPDVTDTDMANYSAGNQALVFAKTVSPTSVSSAGTVVTYSYTVTNSGNTILTQVQVRDDNATPAIAGDDFSPTFISGDTIANGQLDPNETWTYSANQTITQAQIDAGGSIVNTATVTTLEGAMAQASATVTVNQTAAIGIEKLVNGEDADITPGPTVAAGSVLTWTYSVTNEGNIPLKGVMVLDDNGTPADATDNWSPAFTDGDLNTNGLLDPNETWTYSHNGTAVEGQYANTARVTALSGNNTEVTDTDSANYFGTGAAIDLEKLVNGADADSAPGPAVKAGETVTFTFVVVNTGNITLTNVTVTDDVLGPIGTIPSLAASANQTFTVATNALVGQHTNTATAATDEGATDTDAGNYVGQQQRRLETRSLGFWKTHLEFWIPTGYSANMTLDEVFDIPNWGLGDYTLLQALNFGGGRGNVGAARILLRAAVVALLNASHPDLYYPLTEEEIIMEVNDALDSKDRMWMLFLTIELQLYNNFFRGD